MTALEDARNRAANAARKDAEWIAASPDEAIRRSRASYAAQAAYLRKMHIERLERDGSGQMHVIDGEVRVDGLLQLRLALEEGGRA